ncbi:MAG: transglutaminase family protein [Nitrospinae bacterium]|nr:transglutaminase family protein [Nitrospinota bacterium]
MKKYLAVTEFIDHDNPAIKNMAKELATGNSDDITVAKSCFEFVRDEIKHSSDFKINPVTIKASDVLLYGTGYCYAKSHLLAALLRANSIPAGLCYQRLTLEENNPVFCLHGLNAVHLKEFGWFRIDARGNKQGVNAGFNPPGEQLAFSTTISGEANLPEVWSEPLPMIIKVLTECKTWQEVYDNLPNIELY